MAGGSEDVGVAGPTGPDLHVTESSELKGYPSARFQQPLDTVNHTCRILLAPVECSRREDRIECTFQRRVERFAQTLDVRFNEGCFRYCSSSLNQLISSASRLHPHLSPSDEPSLR